MYACATNEFERSAITDMLFGSVTDVFDRYLPDREKHGAIRGIDDRPGRQHHLPRAVPRRAAPRHWRSDWRSRREHHADEEAARRHRLADRASGAGCWERGGEVRLRSKVEEILVADGRVTGVRIEAGGRWSPRSSSPAIAPDLTLNELIDPAALPAEMRERYRAHRPPRQLPADALRAGRLPNSRRRTRLLNDPAMQAAIGLFCTPEEAPAAVGGLPARHRSRRSGGRVADPVGARPGAGARGQAGGVGVLAVVPGRGRRCDYGAGEGRDGPSGDREDHPARTEFRGSIIRHTTFTPRHMGAMFGAPGGDYCHGLFTPTRSGPTVPGRKAISTSRFRSTGCTWAARGATVARASRSSRATTPLGRRWKTASRSGPAARRAGRGIRQGVPG